jgi:hypothetical protein
VLGLDGERGALDVGKVAEEVAVEPESPSSPSSVMPMIAIMKP